MRLVNKTRFSPKKIRKLCRFVFKHFPKEAIKQTEFHILTDECYFSRSISGQAWDSEAIPKQTNILKKGVICLQPSYKGNKIQSKHSYFVVINVGAKRKYPYSNPYKVRAGKAPMYRKFEDEFVHVLAHECAHINQFYSKGTKDDKYYEVEAEKIAHKILAKFKE